MQDEYAYLRGQYQEIVQHCEYLLSHSIDPGIRARASESKTRAEAELARLQRQMSCTPVEA